MSTKDNALRKKSIPFPLNVWGYNRGPRSRQDASDAEELGDLYDLVNISSATVPVRILLPHSGFPSQAYLSIKITPATGDSWTLRIAVAEFDTDGITPLASGYTEEYINNWHRMITKSSAPLTSPVDISNLQIQQALRQLQAENLYQDAFALLLVFSKVPSTSSGWAVTKFGISASAEVTP